MLENFIFAALSITNSRSPKKHKLMFLWTTTWQLFYLQTRGLNVAVNTTKSLGLGLSSLVDQLVELIDYILSTILGFCSYLNYVSFFNVFSHLFAELFMCCSLLYYLPIFGETWPRNGTMEPNRFSFVLLLCRSIIIRSAAKELILSKSPSVHLNSLSFSFALL